MDRAPRFSIVVPAYNAQCWISETIDSVIAQSVDNWELIVVDDGSTDRSAAKVSEYCDRRIRLMRQPNAGQSAAQNRGLAETRGDFILFLDADDRLRPKALEHLYGALARCPTCCLAYGSGVYMTEQGNTSNSKRKFTLSRKPSGNVLHLIVQRNFVAYTGATLIRKAAVVKAGGLRTDLVLAQDWEFWCRLATVGDFVFAGPQVVMEYRMHHASVARSLGADPENQRAAIEAVFNNPAIRERLDKNTLKIALNTRWRDARVFAAIELMRTGQRRQARTQLLQVLRRNAFATKAILLYIATLPSTLPRGVKAHLGIL